MDTRNRHSSLIWDDLKKYKRQCILAVLGSHNVPAGQVAASLRERWPAVMAMIGFEPVRLLTGCAPVGVEKAARIVAKTVTGKLAIVFHRAELVYGVKAAEQMRDGLIVQEANALLLLSVRLGKGMKNIRYLFPANGKKIHEIEVG